jgi:hypothetical protein
MVSSSRCCPRRARAARRPAGRRICAARPRPRPGSPTGHARPEPHSRRGSSARGCGAVTVSATLASHWSYGRRSDSCRSTVRYGHGTLLRSRARSAPLIRAGPEQVVQVGDGAVEQLVATEAGQVHRGTTLGRPSGDLQRAGAVHGRRARLVEPVDKVGERRRRPVASPRPGSRGAPPGEPGDSPLAQLTSSARGSGLAWCTRRRSPPDRSPASRSRLSPGRRDHS